MKDLIASTVRYMEDPAYDSSFNLFIDFSDSIAISYRLDLFEFVDFFKQSVKLKKPIKVCIIYSSPNQEFLLKIYKPMAKLLKMDLEIFKELRDGIKWMNFNEEQSQILKSNLLAIKNHHSALVWCFPKFCILCVSHWNFFLKISLCLIFLTIIFQQLHLNCSFVGNNCNYFYVSGDFVIFSQTKTTNCHLGSILIY